MITSHLITAITRKLKMGQKSPSKKHGHLVINVTLILKEVIGGNFFCGRRRFRRVRWGLVMFLFVTTTPSHEQKDFRAPEDGCTIILRRSFVQLCSKILVRGERSISFARRTTTGTGNYTSLKPKETHTRPSVVIPVFLWTVRVVKDLLP